MDEGQKIMIQFSNKCCWLKDIILTIVSLSILLYFISLPIYSITIPLYFSVVISLVCALRLLKDYAAKEDYAAIEQIITCLGRDFANALTAQPRNGGLIGLAACAIALGKVTTYRLKGSSQSFQV